MENKNNIFYAVSMSDVTFWLMKWKWVVIGITVFFAVIGYVFSNVTYVANCEATASMVINSKSATIQQAGTVADATLTRSLIPTYTRILKSEKIAKYVVELFDINLTTNSIKDMIEVTTAPESQVVYLNVKHLDPYMAKNIANAIIEVAPDVMMEVVEAGSVNVLDYASLPTEPTPPETVQYIVIFAIIGFLLTSVVIVLLNFFMMKVKNADDIERKLNMMVLGEIPHSTATNEREKSYLHTGKANQGFVESNFMMAAVLKNQAQNKKPYKLIVTSTIASEGKTTNSINTATALSDMGYKVLLIDLDMKKPNVSKQLGLDFEKKGGIEAVLMGGTLEDEIVKDERFGFDLVPCTKAIAATSKIFTSLRVEILFSKLDETDYDYIILDSSPANIVADTSVIVKYADGLMLVVKQYFARVKVINDTIAKLKKAGANIIGAVLNDVRVFNIGTGYAFDYKYSYYYYYDGNKKKKNDKTDVYDKISDSYRTNHGYGYGDRERKLKGFEGEVKKDIEKEKKEKSGK